MLTVVDTPSALLVDLAVRGIELQAHGDRLRFRPRAAMTPDLLARIKAHKPELLALLADDPITKTPADDPVSGGFGCGVAGDVLTATSYTDEERRLLVGAPADIRSAVERIKRTFHGAALVRIDRVAAEPESENPAAWVTMDGAAIVPPLVVELAGPRDGWTPTTWRARVLQMAGRCETLNPERASDLRRAAVAMTPALTEVYEERAAIVEYDGGMPQALAEAAAAAETVRLLNLEKGLAL